MRNNNQNFICSYTELEIPSLEKANNFSTVAEIDSVRARVYGGSILYVSVLFSNGLFKGISLSSAPSLVAGIVFSFAVIHLNAWVACMGWQTVSL